MISDRYAKMYCRENISAIENYEKAINDSTQTWICHHRDEVKVLPCGIEVVRSIEELKENGRYFNCPANELIFLTRAEHNRLHHKGNKYGFGRTYSEFGRKFKEHYGKTEFDDRKLYRREREWYRRHKKCRWENE